MTTVSKRPTWARSTLLVLAVALHAGVGFVYVVSGLVAPMWGVGVLLVGWVGLSIWLVRLARDPDGNPLAPLLVPIARAALWFALVQGIGTLFDWTA